MKKFKGLMTSTHPHWATPKWLYEELDKEFDFNDDPCPINGKGGLDREWGTRTYVNPPYGRQIIEWIKKGYIESQNNKLVVMLLPSRTDTKCKFCVSPAAVAIFTGDIEFRIFSRSS